jgi:hypothetical protein
MQRGDDQQHTRRAPREAFVVHVPIDSHLAPGLESLAAGIVARVESNRIPVLPPQLSAAENT